jgi:hypothetical protein
MSKPGLFTSFMSSLDPKTKPNNKNKFVPKNPFQKNIDLNYILQNRPTPIDNLPQNSRNKKVNLTIANKILEYNQQTWNFGNSQGNQLMDSTSYTKFIDFVKKILSSTTSNTTSNTNSKQIYQSQIILEIKKLGFPVIDGFFSVELKKLFPNILGLDDSYFINVTLLGLASIIGAEHLVIYFLMCGANPSATYKSEDKDTATLMLSYQIALSKKKDIKNIDNYFIHFNRLLYILFLLGSIGTGVDLSRIFLSDVTLEKRNQGLTELRESILHQLANLPYKEQNYQNKLTMNTSASIPLLLELIEKNNINGPIFWSDINSKDSPFGYTVLYSILINTTIKGDIKLYLVYHLLEKGAKPLIFPKLKENIRRNVLNSSKQRVNEIQLLIDLLKQLNPEISDNLLKELSKNKNFEGYFKSLPSKNLSQNPIKNNKNKLDRLSQILLIQLKLALEAAALDQTRIKQSK